MMKDDVAQPPASRATMEKSCVVCVIFIVVSELLISNKSFMFYGVKGGFHLTDYPIM